MSSAEGIWRLGIPPMAGMPGIRLGMEGISGNVGISGKAKGRVLGLGEWTLRPMGMNCPDPPPMVVLDEVEEDFRVTVMPPLPLPPDTVMGMVCSSADDVTMVSTDPCLPPSEKCSLFTSTVSFLIGAPVKLGHISIF